MASIASASQKETETKQWVEGEDLLLVPSEYPVLASTWCSFQALSCSDWMLAADRAGGFLA